MTGQVKGNLSGEREIAISNAVWGPAMPYHAMHAMHAMLSRCDVRSKITTGKYLRYF